MSRGYLLDTSVLSVLAPGRPPISVEFADWVRVRSDRLFVSAITIAEIEQGICKLRRAGGSARAGMLSDWLDAIAQSYGDRILAVDAKVGRAAGALSDAVTASGRHPGFADVAIAATATLHQLMLLTRNSRHFAAMGIDHADPFEILPP